MNEKPLLLIFSASAFFILTAFAITLFLPTGGLVIVPGSMGGRGMVAAIVAIGGGIVLLDALIVSALRFRDRTAAYLVSSTGLAVSFALCLKVASLLGIW